MVQAGLGRNVLETKVKKNKGNKFRFLWRGILFVVVSCFLAVAILLAMLQKQPRSFTLISTVSQSEQVSPYLTHYLAPNVHNNIQIDEPFEIVVPQKGINEIIGEEDVLGWEWPVEFNNVVISRPVAVFDARNIRLMGKVDIVGFETVITLCATPCIDKDGLLSLNMQYVRAGAVDISFLAKKTIERVIEGEIEQMDEDEEQYWLWDILGACTDNKPFEPIFPTIYGKYIRLIKSEISESKLILVFEPSKAKESTDKSVAGIGPGNAE